MLKEVLKAEANADRRKFLFQTKYQTSEMINIWINMGLFSPSECCKIHRAFSSKIMMFSCITFNVYQYSVYVLVTKLCPTLWRHGLKPTRLLCPCNSPGKNVGWYAIHFSRGSAWHRAQTWVSCIGRQILYWLSH